MSADLEEFLHEHNIEKVTLIGHSMGAKVAMTLALRCPALLRALISVDNAPVDAQLPNDFHKYVQGMQEIEAAKPQNQLAADDILKKHEKSLAIRQFLLTNFVRSGSTKSFHFRLPVDILACTLRNMGDFPFKDPKSMRYEGPTLFIRGTSSRYVADDVLPLIGQFFPRFKLQDIQGGHWVISDNPSEFRRVVCEFLLETSSVDL